MYSGYYILSIERTTPSRSKPMTVTPAYGRDYKSAVAAKAAWNSGKDFIIQDITSRWDGKPINQQDAAGAGLKIMIRYNGLRNIVNV